MRTLLALILFVSFPGWARFGAIGLEDVLPPERDEVVGSSQGWEVGTTIGDGNVQVSGARSHEYGIIGFGFRSPGANGGERSYRFQFPGRARQAIRLRITDDSKLTGRMSHDLLETGMYFFPRRVLPAVTSRDGNMIVTLPTGEEVFFDPSTKRLIGGVLVDAAPLDLNPERSLRQFAALRYTGEGVSIRVDRRAGIPEEVYTVPFNRNEDITNAVVTYRGRTCKVRKNLLFQQGETTDSYLLFPTDTGLFKFLSARCGWNDLPPLDLAVLSEKLDPVEKLRPRCASSQEE